MPENKSVNESRFNARRFTLTEYHDDRLNEMAENCYGGNASLCVRNAIEDHSQTLEGTGDNLLREISAKLDQIEEALTGLRSGTNETNNILENNSIETDSGHADSLETTVTDDTMGVFEMVLDNHPNRTAFKSIVSTVPQPEIDVHRLLLDLRELNRINAEGLNSVTYGIDTYEEDIE
jgi:hypothetical protein